MASTYSGMAGLHSGGYSGTGVYSQHSDSGLEIRADANSPRVFRGSTTARKVVEFDVF